MKTSKLTFSVTGVDHEQINARVDEAIAHYLGSDAEQADSLIESIDIDTEEGETGETNNKRVFLSYVAQVIVRFRTEVNS